MPGISRNCRRTSSTTAPAALPTDFIAIEENKYGIAAPNNNPTSTSGSCNSKINFVPRSANSATYPAKSTNAANPADAMAYPLVTAFVVLPTASSASVISRTFAGAPLISAMPPALSVIGPKESIATIIPATESMATAASATPYNPASQKLARIAAPIISTGTKVDSIPTESPMIIFVPWPELDASAMDFTGRYFLAV